MDSIFQYTDFRKYFTDYCASLAQRGGKASLRQVCGHLGIKSAGHLSLILGGKASASQHVARNMARFCGLRRRQREYFLLLVEFNQATSHVEKREAFEKLVSFPQSCVYRVAPHQYRFYEKWYHSVIFAMLEYLPVRDTFTELARMVEPSIREYEARASVRLLTELGMVAVDESGVLRPVQKSIDTGSEAASTAINGFAVTMLGKAREAMDRFPPHERMLSWVTVGVDRQGYEEVVNVLRDMRCRIAEVAQRRTAERVYQVNIQLFPVSKTLPERDT